MTIKVHQIVKQLMCYYMNHWTSYYRFLYVRRKNRSRNKRKTERFSFKTWNLYDHIIERTKRKISYK